MTPPAVDPHLDHWVDEMMKRITCVYHIRARSIPSSPPMPNASPSSSRSSPPPRAAQNPHAKRHIRIDLALLTREAVVLHAGERVEREWRA